MASFAAAPRTCDFTYTTCYCEENVYLLCQQLSQSGMAASDASDLFVVFISNAGRKVPIWRQKAGSSENDGIIIWDYHVICIQIFTEKGYEAIVWDLDTTLQFPQTFSLYMKEAFRPWLDLHPMYQRLYRVVAGPLFLKYFASDRRHMRTPEGLWRMPPPPYDCICGEDGIAHNLEDYITMPENTVIWDETLTKESLSHQQLGAVLRDTSLQKLFS